jgi:hypothetical protein
MSWFRKYEYHAEARNKEWRISVDDAVDTFEAQGGRCVLTGVPLSTNGAFADITASLDRINNAEGYTKDNIQWVHKKINMMRGDIELRVFIEACREIAGHTRNWSW